MHESALAHRLCLGSAAGGFPAISTFRWLECTLRRKSTRSQPDARRRKQIHAGAPDNRSSGTTMHDAAMGRLWRFSNLPNLGFGRNEYRPCVGDTYATSNERLSAPKPLIWTKGIPVMHRRYPCHPNSSLLCSQGSGLDEAKADDASATCIPPRSNATLLQIVLPRSAPACSPWGPLKMDEQMPTHAFSNRPSVHVHTCYYVCFPTSARALQAMSRQRRQPASHLVADGCWQAAVSSQSTSAI